MQGLSMLPCTGEWVGWLQSKAHAAKRETQQSDLHPCCALSHQVVITDYCLMNSQHYFSLQMLSALGTAEK